MPAGPPGDVIKEPVRNLLLLSVLRNLKPGDWRKVYRLGRDGSEIHYFEHESGAVALVKHKRK